LEKEIRRALQRSGNAETFDLICHSMGGIVARMVLGSSPDLAARLGQVITIACPHAGTGIARGLLGRRNGRDLALGAAFLRDLPTFSTSTPQARVVTAGSVDDWVVYPPATCHLDGARHIELSGVGHASALTSARAISQVVDALVSDPHPAPQKGLP
jgi:pimeloyl-ACP methyl ester carboxylesterase